MEAKDIVLAARKEYLEINQDEQFKKAFEKVEALRIEADDEVEELKGYEPNDDLTNYVFNKLLEKARKEGGNVFMGDSKDLYEYIFEFYTDYENIKDQFEDKWSQYIRYVSNTSQKPKSKKKSVSDTLEDADALAAKEKKLEEEFKKKEEALKKAAIKEYKEAEAKKKEEAKLKAEEEKKRKEEEAKRKEQEESESLGGLFDLL
jgi:hypothetical protein